MNTMGISFSLKKWDRIFKEIDRNFDNEISLQEFYLFLYPNHDVALALEMKRLKIISQRVMTRAQKLLPLFAPFGNNESSVHVAKHSPGKPHKATTHTNTMITTNATDANSVHNASSTNVNSTDIIPARTGSTKASFMSIKNRSFRGSSVRVASVRNVQKSIKLAARSAVGNGASGDNTTTETAVVLPTDSNTIVHPTNNTTSTSHNTNTAHNTVHPDTVHTYTTSTRDSPDMHRHRKHSIQLEPLHHAALMSGNNSVGASASGNSSVVDVESGGMGGGSGTSGGDGDISAST